MSTTEKYLTKSQRSQAGIDKALDWVKENMSTTDYQPVDRQGVADSLGIAISSINRVVLVLNMQGYLDTKRIGSATLYKVADVVKLRSVKPDQTYAWIRAYNQTFDEKAKQKKIAAKAGKNNESTAPTDEANALQHITQNLPDNMHPSMEDLSKVDTQPWADMLASAPVPLSPAQKLLAEALKLVEAEQNHKSEPEVLPEQLKNLEARLNRLENTTNVILYFFQQASIALRSLPPAQLPFDAAKGIAPLPDLEPSRRAKVNRLVDGYAAAKTVSHQEVWKHLYGQLNSRFGFDAWQYAQSKKNPNYLEIIEENGQLENLYSIAVESLTLSQR